MTEIDLSRYRQDAKGNLIPLENIKETDLLRDELVMEIVAKAQVVRDNIVAFKQSTKESGSSLNCSAISEIVAFSSNVIGKRAKSWYTAAKDLLKSLTAISFEFFPLKK